MRIPNLLWLIGIAVLLVVPRIGSAQDRRNDIGEELRKGFEDFVAGDRRDAREPDWRGTRERDRRDVRQDDPRDRRESRLREDDRRDLEGRWYLDGERDRPTEIVSSRNGLQARNERGRTSRLEIDRDGDIHALDWEDGLRGNVRGDRIEWENGSIWTRMPTERSARRR